MFELNVHVSYQTKTEMLANLLDIEVAYSLLKGGQAGEDPIDAHYKQLKTDMQVSQVCNMSCRLTLKN